MNFQAPAHISVVYFIRPLGSDRVKIGTSRNPRHRLHQLQVGCDHRLTLMRVVDGDVRTEKWLHKRFASLHIRGEWFRYSEEMETVRPPDFVTVPKPAKAGSAFETASQSLTSAFQLGLLTESEAREFAPLIKAEAA